MDLQTLEESGGVVEVVMTGESGLEGNCRRMLTIYQN